MDLVTWHCHSSKLDVVHKRRFVEDEVMQALEMFDMYNDSTRSDAMSKVPSWSIDLDIGRNTET